MTEAELLAQPAEAYMNAEQQAFFRDLLLHQRAELQARIEEEFQALREQEPSSDPADIGSAEEQRHWQLRVLEREKKLLDKIDAALKSEVEEKLGALKTALEADDAADINAKAQDLSQSAMKMGQAIYEQEQANASTDAPEGDAASNAGAEEEVVDAEFSEVDDNKA